MDYKFPVDFESTQIMVLWEKCPVLRATAAVFALLAYFCSPRPWRLSPRAVHKMLLKDIKLLPRDIWPRKSYLSFPDEITGFLRTSHAKIISTTINYYKIRAKASYLTKEISYNKEILRLEPDKIQVIASAPKPTSYSPTKSKTLLTPTTH